MPSWRRGTFFRDQEAVLVDDVTDSTGSKVLFRGV